MSSRHRDRSDTDEAPCAGGPELHSTFQLYTQVLQYEGRVRLDLSDDDWQSRIDKVDRDLVAGLRVGKLYSCAPAFAKRALALMLEKADGGVEPPWNNEERQKEIASKRGIARHPVLGPEGAAVRLLSEECGLFKRYERGMPVRAHAGAFFVNKSNNKLRVITDAREGNSFVNADGFPFELFSVETLLNVLADLSRH